MELISDRRWRSLAWIDALALVLFVVIGVRSHHEGGVPSILMRNLVPLLGSWFGVAWAVGTYRRPGLRSLLATWIVAVPLGLVVRSVWVGSPTGERLLLFLGIGLVFTLLFLLIGRGIAQMVSRRVLPAGRET